MDAPLPAPAVVIVTFQGGPLVARCLAALARQTLPPREILVVVSSADPQRVPEGPTCLVTPSPCGFAVGANLGLRDVRTRSRGDVVLLNDDTVPEPGFLQALVEARRRHGEGIIQPRILLADGSGRLDNMGHGLFPDGFNLARGRGRADADTRDLPLVAGAFSGAAVLLSGGLLDQVGLFDEDLEAFGEDLDLSLRAVRQGYRIHIAPEARIAHVLGASYGRSDPRKVFLVERNRIRAAVRSLPASALATMPLWTALRLASLGLAASRGQGIAAGLGWPAARAVLSGTAAGLSALPDAWAKRRQDRPAWSLGERQMWAHLLRHRVRRADLQGRA